MAAPIFNRIYDLDYFSGSQMFLYIGDIWVDEVTSLQYQASQNKTPIYGYASQLYDTVAPGQVLVQGSFTINYKEQGYLWAVLRRYFNLSAVDAGIGLKSKKQRENDNALLNKRADRPLVGSNNTQMDRTTIERIIRGDANTSEKYQFYNDLASYATFDVNSPKDKIFEDIVEAFEDQVWGTNATNDILNSQLRRTDDNKFDGFDMYVVFGNYAVKEANHTVQKIMDVRLLSQGKSIQIDGMPIQEEYSFIAKSVA